MQMNHDSTQHNTAAHMGKLSRVWQQITAYKARVGCKTASFGMTLSLFLELFQFPNSDQLEAAFNARSNARSELDALEIFAAAVVRSKEYDVTDKLAWIFHIFFHHGELPASEQDYKNMAARTLSAADRSWLSEVEVSVAIESTLCGVHTSLALWKTDMDPPTRLKYASGSASFCLTNPSEWCKAADTLAHLLAQDCDAANKTPKKTQRHKRIDRGCFISNARMVQWILEIESLSSSQLVLTSGAKSIDSSKGTGSMQEQDMNEDGASAEVTCIECEVRFHGSPLPSIHSVHLNCALQHHSLTHSLAGAESEAFGLTHCLECDDLYCRNCYTRTAIVLY